MSKPYDVIVVGARCAGSPTAMLLARRGLRVLLVDRASFPSDTISTHIVHPPGVASLARWGLLDKLVATGTPPIHTYAQDFGPFTLAGSPGELPGYCPRRTTLDKLLVDAAASAGVEVRESFSVEQVVIEDGRVTGIMGHAKDGKTVVEHARVVVGADGLRSRVAQAVAPEQYNETPTQLAWYYSYWSGFPVGDRFDQYVAPNRVIGTAPTQDGLTLLAVAWPHAEFAANKRDLEASVNSTIELVPHLAERVRAGRREHRFEGAAIPGFFRKPYGPGWVLVGDAGYTKDPITAQGISDAFRDAEACAVALADALGGSRSFDDALGEFQRARDEHVLPMYELTCEWASLADPPPEMDQLFAAMVGNQAAMDGFARVTAGVLSPATYFAPDNVAAILASAGTT